MRKTVFIAAAALAAAIAVQPTTAEAQRNRGAGWFVGGLAAGIVGGAIIANRGYAAPHYYSPGYHPGYVYYDEPVVVRPRCVLQRRPVYDQWGYHVGFQRVRVCG